MRIINSSSTHCSISLIEIYRESSLRKVFGGGGGGKATFDIYPSIRQEKKKVNFILEVSFLFHIAPQAI